MRGVRGQLIFEERLAHLMLIFAGGLIAPVFGGTRSAILPGILGRGQGYVLGQATMRMVFQGAQVIGFGVGGLLVAVLGARFALAVDAASFATSALVVGLGVRPQPPATAPEALRPARSPSTRRASWCCKAPDSPCGAALPRCYRFG